MAADRPHRRETERSGVELKPQVSKTLSLEPPPIVKRPEKFKEDTFSFNALSWINWSRTERKEVLHCARSIHRSYYYQTTFRFLGFNMKKDITYRTSEGGIDAAVENVSMVSGL